MSSDVLRAVNSFFDVPVIFSYWEFGQDGGAVVGFGEGGHAHVERLKDRGFYVVCVAHSGDLLEDKTQEDEVVVGVC